MIPHEKMCIVCGSKFLPRSPSWTREKFCNEKCRGRHWNKKYYETHRKPSVDRRRTCVMCSATFDAPVHRPKALTCSKRCSSRRQDARRNPLRRVQSTGATRSCARCQAVFVVAKWGRLRQKYCSKECRVETGRALYIERNTVEKRTARSQRNKWSGAWLAAIQRDGRKCRKCGAGSRLLVHHIDGSGESSPVPNHDHGNLMTLCYACHNAAHSLVYRIIDGEVYVAGPVFDWLGVGDTVKVLRIT